MPRSQRLGLHPVPGTQFGFPAGSTNARLIGVVEHQLVNEALHTLLLQYVIALVVMTLLSSVIGWLLAGRALAPLREITATARRVSGENLRERIALHGPADELKELADTFDGMLARLDGAFAGQRHFVASASHELRTPLAIMRTEVDVSLADPDATVADLRSMGEAVRDMVDRCERLIASLLLLARSEAAVTRDEPVDLAVLAGDCITDLYRRARDAQVTIDAELEPAPTSGDSSLLERLIFNLVDNGIRHNVDRRPADRQHAQPRSSRGARGLQRRRADRPRAGGDAGRAVPAVVSHGRRVRPGTLDRALGRGGARRLDAADRARRRRPTSAGHTAGVQVRAARVRTRAGPGGRAASAYGELTMPSISCAFGRRMCACRSHEHPVVPAATRA